LLNSPAALAAAVLLVTALGAAIGALARPAPANPYTADSVISIQPDAPAAPDELTRQRARWQRADQALKLPQVLSRTAVLSGLSASQLKSRISARGNPDSGLFVIHARGVTGGESIGIAAAATTATIEFLRVNSGNTSGGSSRTAFGFANGVAEDWGLGHSVFLLPPSSTVAEGGSGFKSPGFLRTVCSTVHPGCGTWVNVAKVFSPGRVYSASAWVRATKGSVPLRLGFGSSPEDVADGTTVKATRRWARIRVKWTPRSLVGSAELHVQVNGGGAATFDVDEVAVHSAGGKLAESKGLDIPDRYTVVGPPQSSGKLRTDTVTAALVGAGIGLAAALGGLAFGVLASRRRRHQPQQ
jgi:hypothetical protein